jgi:hypothetical protein
MMKKMLVSVALACTALALPGFALADDAMKAHGAMPGAMTTMLCRPAMAEDKTTQMLTMTADKKAVKVVCMTMTPAMHEKAKHGPDLSKALSADQVDAAWRAFLNSMMVVPATGGG